MTRRILVTGASGFLGGRLVPDLIAQGHEVVATGRSPAPPAIAESGAQYVQLDLSAPVPEHAIREIGPLDALVHSAALSAPFGRARAFDRANVHATNHMIELAKSSGVRRFVNISSPSVYFAPQDQPKVREDMPLPRPINHYARTKAIAERAVLAMPEIGPVSLRPRGIYGSGDRALLPRLLKAAGERPLPLLRDGKGRIDLTHVSDVCRAVHAALDAGPEAEGEAFNISSGEVLPLTEIVEAACARAGVTPRWRPVPFGPVYALVKGIEALYALRPGAPEPPITAYGLALFAFEQSLDLSKAEKVLGWRPAVPFAHGLDETFAEKPGA